MTNRKTRIQRELEATTRLVLVADEAHLRKADEEGARRSADRSRLRALLGWA
jgi:hypothetical protein